MSSYTITAAFIGIDTEKGFSGRFYESLQADAEFNRQAGQKFHVYAGRHLIGEDPSRIMLPAGWSAIRLYLKNSKNVTLYVFKIRNN